MLTKMLIAFALTFGAGAAAPPTLREIGGARAPSLDTARAALVIIDAQREYAEGPLALEGLQPALDEIVLLRAWARRNGVPVIHVRQESRAGAPIFAPGSSGAEFLPEARPAPGEIVVVKRLPNAFADTELHATLQRLGRDQLVLTGFMAHMCLDATTRAGFDLGYENFVVARATADRALPAPGGGVVAAREAIRATLSALNDRFALVVDGAAALERR